MSVKTRNELLAYWNSNIIQNGSQAITGQIMNVGGVDIIDSMAMETADVMLWKGEWVQQEYLAYDTVRDGSWLMIANKTTTDRPAPQASGDPVYIYPGVIGSD